MTFEEIITFIINFKNGWIIYIFFFKLKDKWNFPRFPVVRNDKRDKSKKEKWLNRFSVKLVIIRGYRGYTVRLPQHGLLLSSYDGSLLRISNSGVSLSLCDITCDNISAFANPVLFSMKVWRYRIFVYSNKISIIVKNKNKIKISFLRTFLYFSWSFGWHPCRQDWLRLSQMQEFPKISV